MQRSSTQSRKSGIQIWILVLTVQLFISSFSAGQTGSMSVVTTPMWATRSHQTATTLADGRMLIAGGAGANASLESFQISPWFFFQQTGTMTVSRTDHTATLLGDGRVLLVGGTDVYGTVLSSAEIYDPETGKSNPTAGNMQTARANHQATLLSNGSVLITGGNDSSGAPLATAEIFNPSSEDFRPTAGPMHTARTHHTATLLTNGHVLLAGGAKYSNHDVCSIASCGHPAVWTDGESSAEVYDASTGLFTTTGDMNVGRWDHTATLLPDGRVLILGGGKASELHSIGSFGFPNGVWTVVAVAELYDPITGEFTAIGSLNSGRAAQTATLLPSGAVFVAGGESYSGFGLSSENTSELFDPTSGISVWGPSLNVARAHHTATLLPDSAVLLAGGASNNSAELYWPNGISISVPQSGAISVNTNLQTAIFTITGPATFFGRGLNATFQNAPPGTYKVTFGSASGYLAPAQQMQTLLPGGTQAIAGTYSVDPSSGDFYSQTAVNSTFAGGIDFYPPALDYSRHMIDKIRVYASVPTGANLTLAARGGVFGGGGYFGTLIFPTSVSDAPTFYELKGIPASNPDPTDDPYGYSHTWLSKPLCDFSSLGTYDNECIDSFQTVAGANYYEGIFFDPTGTFYPYLDLADANHSLPATSGTITVNSNLSLATFTISGPANYSGTGTSTTFSDAPTGTYTITFGETNFYLTPQTQTLTLSAGGNITFTAAYTPIMLQVSPNTISFDYPVGVPTAGLFSALTVNANSLLSFTASATTQDGKGWLSVVPGSGDTGTSIAVTVSPNLQPGSYSGQITVTAPNALNSPQVIPVAVYVTKGAGSTPITAGQPILFVHGFCGDAESWQALRSNLSSRLHKELPEAFPSTINYDVYFDGSTVHFSSSTATNMPPPPNARFFSLRFYDAADASFDNSAVAQVSILNKADELQEALFAIEHFTGSRTVIVVAHSMGGLVARAYMEGLATPLSCKPAEIVSLEQFIDYDSCFPGTTAYNGDISTLITLDTPNSGSGLLRLDNQLAGEVFGCFATPTVNAIEMIPGSQLLRSLNYYSQEIPGVKPLPTEVKIHSIESYYSDPSIALKAIWRLSNLASPVREDTAVEVGSQSLEQSLHESAKNATQFQDWGNQFTIEAIQVQSSCQIAGLDVPVLHLLECLGSQPQTQELVHLLLYGGLN